MKEVSCLVCDCHFVSCRQLKGRKEPLWSVPGVWSRIKGTLGKLGKKVCIVQVGRALEEGLPKLTSERGRVMLSFTEH